jgi:hypothetical protein
VRQYLHFCSGKTTKAKLPCPCRQESAGRDEVYSGWLSYFFLGIHKAKEGEKWEERERRKKGEGPDNRVKTEGRNPQTKKRGNPKV